MLRYDAQEAVRRIMGMFEAADRARNDQIALTMVCQGLGLLQQISEPMIDSEIYRGCFIKDGLFFSPFDSSRGWTNYALLEYFPRVRRTALIDPSLWRHRFGTFNISHLQLPLFPKSLSNLLTK